MMSISIVRAWCALDNYKLGGVSVCHQNVHGVESSQALMGELHIYVKRPVVLRVHSLSTKLGVTNSLQGNVRKICATTIPGRFVYSPCLLVGFLNSGARLKTFSQAIYPF